jgi:hypothetical protein
MAKTSVTNLKPSIRKAWSIAEDCDAIGVSRNFLLSQIRKGFLRAHRLGRRIIILDTSLQAYLSGAEQVPNDGAAESQRFEAAVRKASVCR